MPKLVLRYTKKLFLLNVIVLLGLLMFHVSALAQTIGTDATQTDVTPSEVDFHRWYPHDEALVLARAHKRPVMLYFHSQHCAFCEQMNMFVFSAPQVDRLLSQNFVVASIDSGSSEGEVLAKQYRSRGTPTFIFLRYDEAKHQEPWEEVVRFFGSRPRQEFANMLEEVCHSYC